MTRDEIITAARAITDLDTTDVTDVQAHLYLKDGYDRIVAMEGRWPFFEVQANLNTAAGTRTYAVSSLGSGNFAEVTSIVDSGAAGSRLSLVPYDEAEAIWLASGDVAGRPRYFSLWNGGIHLWPKPAAVYPLVVRGYRNPIAWTATNAQADFDSRLHMALVYFVTSEMFRFQTDLEVANSYRKQYEEASVTGRDAIMRIPQASPLILSGGSVVQRRVGPTAGPAPRWGQ